MANEQLFQEQAIADELDEWCCDGTTRRKVVVRRWEARSLGRFEEVALLAAHKQFLAGRINLLIERRKAPNGMTMIHYIAERVA